MNPASRKRLEDFVERVEYLQSLSYLENANDLVGGKITQVDGKWQVEFYQPNDEKRDALLFNLRLFVQDKDDISIRRLAEQYSDPDISDKWKQEHHSIRNELNTRLDRIAAEEPKGKITYRDVFYMFLYGQLGHHDEDDTYRRLFQKWVTGKTKWEILHNTFHDTIVWILAAIINISLASKEELKRVSKNSKDY